MIIRFSFGYQGRGVHIGSTYHCQSFFQTPFVSIRIVAVTICHFDTMQPFALVEFCVHLKPALCFGFPTRMVPDNKCVLLVGRLDSVKKLFCVKRLDVFQKESIEMARRRAACNLRGLDKQNIFFLRRSTGDFEHTIVIRWNILFIRLIFDVVGYGDYVEPFSCSFVDSNGGPDLPI